MPLKQNYTNLYRMPPKRNRIHPRPAKPFEPAKFHDRTENYDIEKEVQEIQEQRKQFNFDEVKQLHEEFAKDNPELFKKCFETEMNEKDCEELVFMLKLRKRVKDGEITFQEANSIISVYFAQRYQPELLNKDMKK